MPGIDKRRLLERASKAAHAFDSRIVKVEASFAEEIREILVATSDGRIAHDVQPLLRFGVRAIAEDGGRRESGSSGGGGRMTLGYFEDKSPEWHAERAARQAITMLDAGRLRQGKWRWCSRPETAASCCTKRSATGSKRTSTAKGTSNYTGRVGKQVASELCTVVDDPTFLQSRGVHQRGRRGHGARAQRADRERYVARLHAGPVVCAPLPRAAPGQRPTRELPVRADAAHDQHRLARGAPRSRRRSCAA